MVPVQKIKTKVRSGADLRHYELVVVLSPILSQEESTGVWDRIKQLIDTHGGDITQEEAWGMRRLAYPIRKGGQAFQEGNYILARFSTDTMVPRELEAQLTLAEDVLRYLVVRSGIPTAVTAPPQQAAIAPVGQPPAEAPVTAVVAEQAAEVPAEVQVAEAEPAVATAEETEPVVAEAEEVEEAVEEVPTEPEAEEPEPIAAQVEETAEEEPAEPEAEEAEPRRPRLRK